MKEISEVVVRRLALEFSVKGEDVIDKLKEFNSEAQKAQGFLEQIKQQSSGGAPAMAMGIGAVIGAPNIIGGLATTQMQRQAQQQIQQAQVEFINTQKQIADSQKDIVSAIKDLPRQDIQANEQLIQKSKEAREGFIQATEQIKLRGRGKSLSTQAGDPADVRVGEEEAQSIIEEVFAESRKIQSKEIAGIQRITRGEQPRQAGKFAEGFAYNPEYIKKVSKAVKLHLQYVQDAEKALEEISEPLKELIDEVDEMEEAFLNMNPVVSAELLQQANEDLANLRKEEKKQLDIITDREKKASNWLNKLVKDQNEFEDIRKGFIENLDSIKASMAAVELIQQIEQGELGEGYKENVNILAILQERLKQNIPIEIRQTKQFQDFIKESEVLLQRGIQNLEVGAGQELGLKRQSEYSEMVSDIMERRENEKKAREIFEPMMEEAERRKDIEEKGYISTPELLQHKLTKGFDFKFRGKERSFMGTEELQERMQNIPQNLMKRLVGSRVGKLFGRTSEDYLSDLESQAGTQATAMVGEMQRREQDIGKGEASPYMREIEKRYNFSFNNATFIDHPEFINKLKDEIVKAIQYTVF